MNDKFDEQSEIIKHNNSILESYRNIIDLVGEDALGISDEVMSSLSRASVQSAKNEMEIAKSKLDTNKALYESTLAEYETLKDTLDGQEKERWEETIKNLEGSLKEAESEFMSSWTAALQEAANAFDESVERVVKTFKDAMAGLAGSDEILTQRFEQQKEISDRYLDDYKKIYELSKLNRNITKSIDETDSVTSKSKLRDLQKEINALQESNAEMTQYEVDELQARYELRLAEIALEDAQNAKSQVRMSRDNDGNWSYVYTADEATVADAAQTYEDKMFQMQQTSNDYLDQISEQWIATTIEMEQAYQKIYEDRTLSDEERMAAIDRLTEYYDTRFLYFNDQITNALGNNQILYEEDWLSWANKNNLQIESNNSFKTSFDNTVLGLTTGFTTIDGLHQNLINAVGSPDGGGYLGSLQTSYNKWREDVDGIMEAAGTSVENFGKDFSKVADETVRKSEEIAGEVDDMAGQMEDAFGDVVDAVQDWRDEYSDAIANNIAANDRMIQSLADLLIQINKTIDAQIKLNSVTGEGPTSTSGGYDGDAGGPGDEEPEENGNPPKYNYRIYSLINGGRDELLQEIINITEENFLKVWKRQYGADKTKYFYTKFDTGGYTGDWGQSGKLAMLHEKELVLNKDDTANFLSAINIVRDIVKVVDMNAAISGMGIGALAAGGIAGAGSTIEQSVTIYADFPNATDHSEIELALANLMNSASQYANRKGQRKL